MIVELLPMFNTLLIPNLAPRVKVTDAFTVILYVYAVSSIPGLVIVPFAAKTTVLVP